MLLAKSIVAQLVGTSWCVRDIHGSNPPSSDVIIELSTKKKKKMLLKFLLCKKNPNRT